MADIQTLNGNLLLNTDPSATTMPLSVSRTDTGIAGHELAQISLFGGGTNNLQGTIILSTMNNGAANGPLEERLRVHSNGNIGIGSDDPKASLSVVGTAMVSDGSAYAVPNAHVAPGSLTIGSLNPSFGGGQGWHSSTAGLLLETKANTEIAVHDAGT